MRILFCFSLLSLILATGCQAEPQTGGKTVTEWISLLTHEDWSTQDQASLTIARMGPAAVPYLVRVFRAKDPALRRGLVITLARIGPGAKAAIPKLLRRMALEQVADIRAEILKALVLIDPKAPGVEEELTKRLRDLTPVVRDAAQAGLDLLHPPVKPAPPTEAGPVADDTFLLREAVSVEMKKQAVTFGIAAEVVRENRRAAIVWPAIKNGKVLDDDIVAYVFEDRPGSGWTLVAPNIGLTRGDGAQQLTAALGGADKQRVVHPCGVERERLPSFLEEKGKAFRELLAAGKPEEAVGAYEELTQAFSYGLASFNDLLPTLLVQEKAWKFLPATGGPESALSVEIPAEGGARKGTLKLQSCGKGWVVSEIGQ